MNGHIVLIGAVTGMLVTATSDVGAFLGQRLGLAGQGPRRVGPNFIGRWFGYMLRAKFRHADISQTSPLPGELPLGLAAHYLIGIIFTLAYGAILFITHMAPTPLSAMLFGLVTVVFLWFLMFPSEGLGWMGRNAPADVHLPRMSLYTHLIFGLGLALWISILKPF